MESLTKAECATAKMVHSHAYWQKATGPHWRLVRSLAPCHMGLSLRLLECPCDTTSPPRGSELRKKQRGCCDTFYALVLEVTHCQFCHLPFIFAKVSPYSGERNKMLPFGEKHQKLVELLYFVTVL